MNDNQQARESPKIGVSGEVKIHFLNSYPEFSPENLGDVSKEQGGCLHKDVKVME